MCESVTIQLPEITEVDYDIDSILNAYEKETLETTILDFIFDGPFWNSVGHYLQSLDLAEADKNWIFEQLKTKTMICVSAPNIVKQTNETI